MAPNSNTGPTLPTWFSSILNVSGYVLGFAAGLFALIYGIAFAAAPASPVMWGVAILACVTIALVSGAAAKPDGSLSKKKIKFGGKFSNVPMVAWLVIFGIILISGLVQLVAL